MLKLSPEFLKDLRRKAAKALLSSKGNTSVAKGYLTLLDEIDEYRKELNHKELNGVKVILNAFEFRSWYFAKYPESKEIPVTLEPLLKLIAEWLNESISEQEVNQLRERQNTPEEISAFQAEYQGDFNDSNQT